jgi:uncharacterized protein DUF6766
MVVSGLFVENHSLAEHKMPPIGALEYLVSGEFLSALFENWESEFLQMSSYVVLTAMLFQRGSSESRDLDAPFRPNDKLTSVWGGRPRGSPGFMPIRWV